MQEGPSLYRRFQRNGRWEQSPCEIAVELDRGDDPETGAWQGYPQEEAARESYWAALSEDKLGGIPMPTPFGRRFGADFDGWQLLLQLNAKDNAEESDPFFLNRPTTRSRTPLSPSTGAEGSSSGRGKRITPAACFHFVGFGIASSVLEPPIGCSSLRQPADSATSTAQLR